MYLELTQRCSRCLKGTICGLVVMYPCMNHVITHLRAFIFCQSANSHLIISRQVHLHEAQTADFIQNESDESKAVFVVCVISCCPAQEFAAALQTSNPLPAPADGPDSPVPILHHKIGWTNICGRNTFLCMCNSLMRSLQDPTVYAPFQAAEVTLDAVHHDTESFLTFY